MVRTLHSAAAVVLMLAAVVEVGGGELEAVGVELEVVAVDVDEVVVSRVVVVGTCEVVVDGSTLDEVVRDGAAATGLSPTWESARPTICHVNTVVRTRAATQAAAMRQLIMCQLSQDRPQ